MVFFLMRVAYFSRFISCATGFNSICTYKDWWVSIYLYRQISTVVAACDLTVGLFLQKLDKINPQMQYGLLPYINLITFYERFLTSRVYVANRVVNNSMSSNQQSLITRIYLSVSRLLSRSKIQLKWYSFIYIFVWACINRDLTLVNNYLTAKICRMHFKKHKKFFSLLRYIFFCVFKCLLQLGFVAGFLCKISGKIGLAGSVKTKSLIFAYGRTRLSNKGGLLKTTISQIWTRTGVLGLRMYLVYNI